MSNRKEYLKQWRQKNPDKYKSYCKKWRQNNPDKVKKYREEYKEQQKEWVKNNPDKIKENNKRYLRFKDKQTYIGFNPRKNICQNCGKQGLTHMHHIEYHNDDLLKDTIELCVSCHMKESWILRKLKDNINITNKENK